MDASVEKLIEALQNDPTMIEYQEAKARIDKMTELNQRIQQTQKENQNAVNFDHIELSAHAEKSRERSQKMTEEIMETPEVKHYQETLFEANELLQYVTGRITKAVNQASE